MVTFVSVHPPLGPRFTISSQGWAPGRQPPATLPSIIADSRQSTAWQRCQSSRWPALNPELSHLPYIIIPREKGLGIGLGAFWDWSASQGAPAHCRTLPPVSRFWGLLQKILESKRDQVITGPETASLKRNMACFETATAHALSGH